MTEGGIDEHFFRVYPCSRCSSGEQGRTSSSRRAGFIDVAIIVANRCSQIALGHSQIISELTKVVSQCVYYAPNIALSVPKRFVESDDHLITWRQLTEDRIAPKRI